MNDSWRDLKRNGFIFKSRIRKIRFLLLVRGLLNNQFSTSRSASKRGEYMYILTAVLRRRNWASFSILSVFLFFFFVFACFFLFLLSTFSRFILIFFLSAFFHPPFTILIFPSASAIRRYSVRVLQTPPLTTVKIRGRLNPFVTSEIRNLMRSRDRWKWWPKILKNHTPVKHTKLCVGRLRMRS